MKKYIIYYYNLNIDDIIYENNRYFITAGKKKYIFEYKDKHLTIVQYNGHDYLRPQVMYIPAERNFMVGWYNYAIFYQTAFYGLYFNCFALGQTLHL